MKAKTKRRVIISKPATETSATIEALIINYILFGALHDAGFDVDEP